MNVKGKIGIERFMIDKLGLSGNGLVLFAVLWMESKGATKEVKGNYTWLSAMMGVSIPTTYNCLSSLESKGLVQKTSVGTYRVTVNEKGVAEPCKSTV